MDFHSIWSSLEQYKKNDFLVTPEYKLSNRDLIDLVGRLVTRFDECNVSVGGRVLILTHNEGAAIVAFIASLLDGLAPVMLTPDTPDVRVDSIVGSTEPDVAVIDDVRQNDDWVKRIPVRIAIQTANDAKRTWSFGFGREPEAMRHCGLSLAEAVREPRLPEINDELAYLLFTSGTTQDPSGVMISRRNIIANLRTISRLFDCNPETRLFNDVPLAHGDGLVQGPLLAMANAATLIRSGGVAINNLENWLNRVRQQRATHFLTVPTVWSFIDMYAVHDDYFDSDECRSLTSVAAKLEKELWRRLQNRFGKVISNQYGLTETVASALYAAENHPEMGSFGSVGRPVDCEARIKKVDGVDSESGELQLRGDNIFQGYWKNPQRTTETFTQDGWMKTGDVVKSRPDGSYEILGRLKTIIMSGGFLIRPEEIDEVLLMHPSVIESVTVAILDSVFGEVPVTAVVLSISRISENSLMEYARSNLEKIKVPKRIIPLDSVPRGDSGKPKLNELKEKLRIIIDQENEYSRKKTDHDYLKKVYQIAAQILHVDSEVLKPTSSPDSIESWDSFSHVALIIAMETNFSIKIPVKKATSIRNFGDLVDVIEELLK